MNARYPASMARRRGVALITALLIAALAGNRQLDRQEGRVIDLDAALLDRRGQPIDALLVAIQDRCEELDQRFAANGRAMVEPSSVAGDAHVKIAADDRVRPGWIGLK